MRQLNEVDRWIQENNAFAAKGEAVSRQRPIE